MLTLQKYLGNVQRNLCRSEARPRPCHLMAQMANLQGRLKGGCSHDWLPHVGVAPNPENV